MQIIHIGSGTGRDSVLNRAAVRVREEGRNITLWSCCSEELDANEETFAFLTSQVPGAGFVLVILNGTAQYFTKFPRFIEILETTGTPAVITSADPTEMNRFRHLNQMPDEDYNRIITFLDQGGDDNMRSLLLFLYRCGTGFETFVNDPFTLPTDGIYHPDWYREVHLREYLLFLPKKTMRVGIVFDQRKYHTRECNDVDILIRALEEDGFATIPVYAPMNTSVILQGNGDRAMEKYFRTAGHPGITLLVALFSYPDIIRFTAWGRETAVSRRVFSDPRVPVLPVISTGEELEPWSGTLAKACANRLRTRVFGDGRERAARTRSSSEDTLRSSAETIAGLVQEIVGGHISRNVPDIPCPFMSSSLTGRGDHE